MSCQVAVGRELQQRLYLALRCSLDFSLPLLTLGKQA